MYTRKFPMTQLSSDTSNFKFANMYWVNKTDYMLSNPMCNTYFECVTELYNSNTKFGV